MNAKIVAALAAEVRSVLDAHRKQHDDEVADLQRQIDALLEQVKAIPAGPQGERGAAGEKGEKGDAGERGATGERGPDGRDGLHGKDGKDGRDGRDGEDSDVTRDQLDKATSEAIAKAIAGVSFDGRTFRMGERELARIPTLGFRGVYQHGTQYEPGDTVQWGGSLFVCTETTSEQPDKSNAWALAARKGRDGKDRA